MRLHSRCLGTNPARGIALFVSLGLLLSSQLAHAEDEGVEQNVSIQPEPPPRPPMAAPLVPSPPPVTRHVDVGASVVLLQRVTEGQTDAGETFVRYPAAVGAGATARVEIMRYLRANLYAMRASSEADPPANALGLPGDASAVPITTYSFGLRLAPTLPLGPRARTWLSVGAGWGRVEVGRFDVVSSGGSFQVRERAFSFVELPVGIGTSFDIIPNWLVIELEVSAAFHVAQRGTALRTGQTIDSTGHRIAVGPFPQLAATFTQTIGLALVL